MHSDHRVPVRPAGACALLALLCLGTLSGCVTPVLLTRRHAAIGLWSYRAGALGEGVRSERVEGVGLGVLDGSAVVGYAHRHTVTVDSPERNFRFTTPWVEAAGGGPAAAIAVQDLLPSIGTGESRSVP